MSKQKGNQNELKMTVPSIQPKVATGENDDYWPSRLKPKKTFQILVSGGVMVTKPELEIIDTPEFQRLRRVRQLGTACAVYPTALHTRFDHSLGALEMVEYMMQCILRNEHSSHEEKDITPRHRAMARIYALIHDITHVPFGHTIEDELGILERHDENEERINYFLGSESNVGKIIIDWFGKDFHTDLLRVYRWDENPTTWDGPLNDVFIHDLVSNTVCADLLDYLRRDDHFCNLGVGMSFPFLNYLYLGEESHRVKDNNTGVDKELKFRRVFVRLWKTQRSQPRRDVLSDLCRLLEARYLVAERVYFHHAKVIGGTMLGRAIQEARHTGAIDEKKMWEHSDDTLVFTLMNLGTTAPLSTKLATAYWHRKFYKCAFEYRVEDIDKTQASDHSENWMREHIQTKLGNAQERREFENHLAELLMVSEGDILIYYPDQRMNLKQAEMRVLWKGKRIPFREVDDPVTHPRLKAVLEAHERLWSIRVLVAPTVPEDKRGFLKEICDLELLTRAGDARRAREGLYERIVWNEIEKNPPQTALPPAETKAKIKLVAATLCEPAKDTREKFAERVRKAITEQFS